MKLDITGYPFPVIISSEFKKSSGSTEALPISNSIAWGWGPKLNRYLKGIESLCNEISNIRNINTALSTEGSNAGEAVKKIINWIVEKLKMLANIIKQFFIKVNEFINKNKASKYFTPDNLHVAELKLLNIIDTYHDNGAVNMLITKNLLFACYNAEKVYASIPMREFNSCYGDLVTDIKNKVYRRDKSEELITRYDKYRKSIRTGLNNLKEDSLEQIEKVKKFIDYKNEKHPAVFVLHHYHSLIMANDFIKEHMDTLNTLIAIINSDIKEIENNKPSMMRNESLGTEDIQVLQTQVSLMSDIISGLLSLQITQAIPTISKAIVYLCTVDLTKK
jgi:hypothetical protein